MVGGVNHRFTYNQRTTGYLRTFFHKKCVWHHSITVPDICSYIKDTCSVIFCAVDSLPYSSSKPIGPWIGPRLANRNQAFSSYPFTFSSASNRIGDLGCPDKWQRGFSSRDAGNIHWLAICCHSSRGCNSVKEGKRTGRFDLPAKYSTKRLPSSVSFWYRLEKRFSCPVH